jgi:hypothetical protein
MKDVDYISSGGELKKENRIRWSYSQSVLNSAGCEGAHRRKLGHNSGYRRQDIDDEVRQIVVRKVCADQKQQYGDAEQKLLGGCVLVPVVNLLPHVEVVKGARVEVKGHAAHVVEHEVRCRHVREVDHGPRRLLRHTWNDVEEDLAQDNEDRVDHPCAWRC